MLDKLSHKGPEEKNQEFIPTVCQAVKDFKQGSSISKQAFWKITRWEWHEWSMGARLKAMAGENRVPVRGELTELGAGLQDPSPLPKDEKEIKSEMSFTKKKEYVQTGAIFKEGVIEESHSAFYRANYLLRHMNGTEKKKEEEACYRRGT